MRITGGKTHIVDTLIPEEHRVRSGAGYKLRRQAAFVELQTGAGLTGYGPCSFGSASLDLGSVASLCDNTFAAALRGEDAHRIEHLWHKLYYGSSVRVHGGRSVGVAILSAIDIALWDLKGKALGVPVYQLLGGAFHDPVPCHSSSVSNVPMIEYDRTYNDIQEKLVANPLDVHDSVIELPTEPGLGEEIDWDFVAAHPSSGEIGIGAGSRPAFGLAGEVIPDRTSTSLA
jgi:L-alanine-DL-glutamate epimerase-like enolase superfamily enzyme